MTQGNGKKAGENNKPPPRLGRGGGGLSAGLWDESGKGTGRDELEALFGAPPASLALRRRRAGGGKGEERRRGKRKRGPLLFQFDGVVS